MHNNELRPSIRIGEIHKQDSCPNDLAIAIIHYLDEQWEKRQECNHLWNGCEEGLRCIYCGQYHPKNKQPKVSVEDIERAVIKYAKNKQTSYHITTTSGTDEERTFDCGTPIDLKGLTTEIVRLINNVHQAEK